MERILAQKKELQYTLSDEVTRLADELLLQCRMLSIHKVIAKRVSLVERALLKNLEASFHGWATLCLKQTLKEERLAFNTITEDHKALVADLKDLSKVNQSISEEMELGRKRSGFHAIGLVLMQQSHAQMGYFWKKWLGTLQVSAFFS